MKNTFSTFMLIAAAALTFTSCNKETIDTVDDTVEVSPVTLHITADAGLTKSVFGDKVDGAYSVKWTADKQVAFSLNETTPVGVYPEVINEGAGTSFDVTFTEGGETGTVYAFSPMGVYDNTNPVPGFTGITAKYDDVYLNIPSEQTPLANSCDQSAQALFASQEYNGSDTEINMTFSHVVAYGKMAVKNFTGIISKVDIVFPVAVCGTSCYYYYDGEKKGTIEKANINTITLNPDYVVDNVFWFACAPTEGATGEMKIIITDNNDKTYTKTIDLTAKALPFIKGQVSTFGVNMSGIAADENEPVIPDGDYAILAKRSTGNYFFMTSDLGSASTKRYQAVDSGLSTLPESLDVNGEQIWTVTNSADGMIISSNSGQQITWSSGNSGNLVETGKKLSAKEAETTGAYNISIVETPNRILALNLSNPYFAFYEGTQAIDLFFVPATHAAPTKYKINVNATTNGTVIASKDEAEAGETITITVTPDTGYQLDALTYNGNDIKSSKSFEMPAEDVTIAATFAKAEGGQGGDNEPIVLTFDLSSNPGGWPTTNSTTLTDYTYTLDDTAYSFGLKNVKCNSGYLMLTQPAVLGLPAIEGKKLTKIVAKNSSGCSTSTKVGVSSSSSSATYIDGGAIQTWSTTSTEYTYNLTGTANNTVYYLYVTNKNAQIVTLTLTYE